MNNDWQRFRADYLWNQFTANFSHSKGGISNPALHNPFLSLPFLILIALLIPASFILRLIFRIKKSLEETPILLEITPPSLTEKSAYTTSQLFSTFHNLGSSRSKLDKLLGKKPRFSFEIVSTKSQGIRYLVKTTPDQVSNIKKNLLTYLPQVSIQTINEYLPKDFESLETFHSKVVEYKLGKSFTFPLQKQNVLEESDPVGYITGMMTKLSPGELISFQIVLSPIVTKEVGVIANKIRNNEDVLEYLRKPSYPWYARFIFGVGNVVTFILKEVFGGLGQVIREAQSNPDQIRAMRAYETESRIKAANFKPTRVFSPYEQEIIQSIQGKIAQPLFNTSIRLLVIVKDKQELKERINGFSASLSNFSVPNYQSLSPKRNIIFSIKIRTFLFKNRLLSLRIPRSDKFAQLISSSEISDLFHFPFTRVTQTENIVKSYSRELPAPISLKQDTRFDVTFGRNTFGGVETIIGLTSDQRARHMVIFGGTGNGKTTLISEMLQQDMKNGKGLCFIDPHGDAAERALQMVPKEREKDVVWIDPYDIDFPFAINLMELTSGLSRNDALREKERVAEGIVSLFRRVCAKDFSKAGSNAFRIENTLLNAVYTAFYVKDATLFTIYDLLNDPAFLKVAVARIDDKRLKDFWKNEYGRAGDYQIVKMIGGVTARIGKFLHSESARRIFEQPKSTLNFDELMDSKKIILCNLSKGKLTEGISQVIGTAILTKIQLATMRRALIPEDERVPFYLYIDEFQNFATDYFVEMLSEARKYKLNIVIVEQSTSQQQDQSIINIILANVAIVICFRTANPSDEEIILTQFAPQVKKGEIMNLPWYHFFIKIYAQVAQEPFTGETIPLSVKYDREKAKRIIEMSRKKYGNVYKDPKIKVETESVEIKESGQEEISIIGKVESFESSPPEDNLAL